MKIPFWLSAFWLSDDRQELMDEVNKLKEDVGFWFSSTIKAQDRLSKEQLERMRAQDEVRALKLEIETMVKSRRAFWRDGYGFGRKPPVDEGRSAIDGAP